jgi:hypothetical protein
MKACLKGMADGLGLLLVQERGEVDQAVVTAVQGQRGAVAVVRP